MSVMVKKPHCMTIESYYTCLEEFDALAPSLTCLKDQHDCPPEIECMSVSLTPVNMYNLVMHIVSAAVKDEYNCMTDLMPTDLKKLLEQLLRTEIKLKLVTSEMKPEDHQICKGQSNTCKKSQSNKKRHIAEAGHELKDGIPWKATPKKVEKQCKLWKTYGGVSYSHQTAQCKIWIAGRK